MAPPTTPAEHRFVDPDAYDWRRPAGRDREGAAVDGGEGKLEVVRKLLAKAEGAATAAEASAYNAKAAQMMARHGIDEAMLAASGATTDVLGERSIVLSDPYSREKAALAGMVGDAMGCRVVQHRGAGRGTIVAVTVFGYESDLARTEVLFTSLLLQATREVVHQRPPVWTAESIAAFRRTWLTGFASEIHRRLTASHQAAAQEHAYDQDRRLRYLGQVGTGFTDAALRALAQELTPLAAPGSGFDEDEPPAEARGVRWVRPVLVGEAVYRTVTPEGRLRHAA